MRVLPANVLAGIPGPDRSGGIVLAGSYLESWHAATGTTDNAPAVPGFESIRDELAYMSRTWHTDLDTFDHGLREDLMQSANIMASFLYHAAMRPERLPRKPLPEAPPKPAVEPAPAG